MDNKIKIVVVLFLSIFFSSCVGWLDDDHIYERKLNSWASIRYFSTNQGFTHKEIDIYLPTDTNKNKEKRIDLDFNFKRTPEIIKGCISVIYNNNYILAINKRYANDSSYSLIDCYYKIIASAPTGYEVDTISKSRFDSLVSECTDCQELDADKIRAMDYELDHGGFPTKTVLFLLLVIAYIFYRIRKKKSKKK